MSGVPPSSFKNLPPSSTPLTQKNHPLKENGPAQIRELERNTQTRITQLEKQTKEAELEMARHLEERRDQYDRRRSEESLEQEQSLENQKLKGYEELRKLQRTQNEELNRTRREGEEALGKAKNYYRYSVEKTIKDGESALNETLSRYQRALEYDQKSKQGLADFEKNEHAIRLNQLKEEQDKSVAAIQKAGQEHHEKTMETTLEAMKQTEDHFLKNYKDTTETQQEALKQLQNRTADTLNQLRWDTATKLAAYSSRQKDPFYQMVKLETDLDETDDSYILAIQIPEHEQENIAISIRGNELVVSGQRRNEENLKLDSGQKISTSSYQSFSESFPIPFPVEGKLLTREYDGDELIVRIPKKTKDLSYKPKDRLPINTALPPQRPNFPKNLPISEGEKKATSVLEQPTTQGRKTKQTLL